MAIPAGLLRRARKFAGAKETTVNAMIRKYLEEITQRGNSDADARIARLKKSWDKNSFTKWSKPVRREDLYDR